MLTAQINTIVESSLDESSFATTWQKEYENEHGNCLVMHNNSNEENEELRMWIDQVQIDAQCSDLDILIGAGEYLKNRVVYITAEPEHLQYNNSEHNNFDNIQKYMESQDFLLINHPNTNDPTFINKNFLYLKDKIYIAQIG
jgi:hypothetical protein